ncbi:hypothetical protein AB0M28_40265 [Streptomyces sp. NPDC051940]|uniref:hypothetical protein n=1 Tax=Streptomyces sp. NPDC051940 TaxID=3155675 RepID=UPI003445E8C9
MTTPHDAQDELDWPGAELLVAAGDAAPPAADVVAAALEAVRTAAAAEQASAVRNSRRRRHVASAALVAAVVAGATIVPAVDMGGNEAPATASASEFLNAMAKTAAAEPASDAEIWKSVVEYDFGDVDAETRARNIEIFNVQFTYEVRPDGSVERLIDDLNDWVSANTGLTWASLKDLPTDPAALRTRLTAGVPEQYAESDMIQWAGDLLAISPAGPELRAALFQIMAQSSQVRLVENAHDAKGRPGTELHWDLEGSSEGGSHWIWLVDPETADLLEMRFIPNSGDGRQRRETYLYLGPA